MSRFADPSAVEVVPLGACQCPGTPHERDEATVRYSLSASAYARIGAAELASAKERDPFAAHRQLVLEAVTSWTLQVLHNDKPVTVPIVAATVAELDEATLLPLAEAIDNLIQERGTAPNASGAPSAASPRESASPTPTSTPTPGT